MDANGRNFNLSYFIYCFSKCKKAAWGDTQMRNYCQQMLANCAIRG